MKIAFYAPLKSPDHPVPSGDRLMARQLMAALQADGHEVAVVSELRSFLAAPSADEFHQLEREADAEIARVRGTWQRDGAPDLWFCYHPYYKAPDLLGPVLAAEFSMPYVTAEASYSMRRNEGVRAIAQRHVLTAIEQATVNICLTRRDRDGLLEAAPACRHAMLAPFIDATPFVSTRDRSNDGCRMVAVAMMRSGDKMDSYRMLAKSLAFIADSPWVLTVVGDGPCREEVQQAFAALPSSRLQWLGEKKAAALPGILASGDLYVWPGCGEAYGLAYLEAQATGLPVLAQRTAGVPEVVRHGETGILTPEGDVGAYAAAMRDLIGDPVRRRQLGAAARRFVHEERSFPAAAQRLRAIFDEFLEARA
ncbi:MULTISPECIES: glycosyltransferase family 4 protein [unclassified Ensifer]|uniref:glycosyltransferase family 4 protein n=1 Tax=unclassified Ensifer TaxID=2633371 RepID=UPI000812D376|nr:MULTISPECIES: glycosyltransferase family 4 protein [unclassified Ensifer]OCO99211.1 glycosyl transferase [Ensifer sp. LC11]OCO99418.1 glycosyl transferase [Ensifer sp. LC13]OCP12834.1 glycosyl transferase [Ensifer sp. LC14]OCP29544.1 glycosyl transferase [Ensifer sp. LC499]